MTGIMGDEDNPQEERLDSVIEILSGATEEVRRKKSSSRHCTQKTLFV